MCGFIRGELADSGAAFSVLFRGFDAVLQITIVPYSLACNFGERVKHWNGELVEFLEVFQHHGDGEPWR